MHPLKHSRQHSLVTVNSALEETNASNICTVCGAVWTKKSRHQSLKIIMCFIILQEREGLKYQRTNVKQCHSSTGSSDMWPRVSVSWREAYTTTAHPNTLSRIKKPQEWQRGKEVVTLAISSLGFSGTNLNIFVTPHHLWCLNTSIHVQRASRVQGTLKKFTRDDLQASAVYIQSLFSL